MTIRVLIVALALLFVSNTALGQSDSTFTYQGELQDGGSPADGAYNLTFRLFDAAFAGNAFGSLFISNNYPVTDGLFEIRLDFGADALGSVGSRWLEITVNGVTLSPRTLITASPYSVHTRGIFVNNQNRVGIGTELPFGLLHLRKQTPFSNFPDRMLVIDSHDDPNSFDLESGSGSGILFKVPYQSDSRVGAAIDAVRTTNAEVDSSTALAFSTSANSQTLNEGMRIVASGDVQVHQRFAIGTTSTSLFAPLTVADAGLGLPFGINAQSNSSAFPTILATNNGSGPVLWASGSNDVSLGGGGMILIGAEAGLNLTMDRNEIMVRNNGAPSPLFLNHEGGQVKMGEYDMHPAYAYGRLRSDGTLVSGSSNISSTARLSEGRYAIVFVGGILSSDIFMTSTTAGRGFIGGDRDSGTGQLRIDSYNFLLELADRPFYFVVYRP